MPLKQVFQGRMSSIPWPFMSMLLLGLGVLLLDLLDWGRFTHHMVTKGCSRSFVLRLALPYTSFLTECPRRCDEVFTPLVLNTLLIQVVPVRGCLRTRLVVAGPPAMLPSNRMAVSYVFSMLPVAEAWRHLILRSASVALRMLTFFWRRNILICLSLNTSFCNTDGQISSGWHWKRRWQLV